MDAPTAPIPAATLVVLRDRADGPPELLMVERARAMAFAPGALVFPGGRIDPGDHLLARAHPDIDQAAARIAAIRETLEETGLAVGLRPTRASPDLAGLRRALHAGEPFGEALSPAGAALDPAILTYFARWLPNHPLSRVFDTRFFLARVPPGAPPLTVDATENSRLFWAGAADVLADADAGRATLIYPTRRNLERLARFPDFAAAIADAHAHPVRTITPVIEDRDGVPHLCIPADLGYPVTAQALDTARRA